jgi:DNA-binding transcriptional MerR regulator
MTIKEQIGWLGKWAWKGDKSEQNALTEIRQTMHRIEQLERAGYSLELIEELIKNTANMKADEGKLYQEFVEAYDVFCKSYIGVGAKMSGAQGKALKDIIEYLRGQSRTKDSEGALAAWQYILKNWGRLTKFIQNQTTLTQINKNLQEILTQLRNGATTNQGGKAASASVRDSIRRRTGK